LFEAGAVRVDGRPAAKGWQLSPGVTVRVELPPSDGAAPDASLELEIALEGRGFVVIDKPAGVPSAARDGRDSGTIANALVARFPAMSSFGHHPREAGLVHRLDTHTSGLLLAGKSEAAFRELVTALREGRLQKRYLALALDVARDEGSIQSRIGAGPGRRVVVSDVRHGAPARTSPSAGLRTTEYRVVGRQGRVAWLELRVAAAYRHQIRAQLAAIGCPIVGDALYGEVTSLPRHALHASLLSYPGGEHVSAFEVASGWPPDLDAIARQLASADP
jgi:23S rRNA pseudouridine1911/1915/1917 synthase